MPKVSGLGGTQPWLTTDSRGTSVGQWLESCFVPCMTFGRVYNRLEKLWEQRDARLVSDLDCCNFKCWTCCICCPCWSCLMARQRTRIRKFYDIAGSYQDDCWYSCCRPCCVLIQDERELMVRAEGLDPKSDHEFGSVEIFEKPFKSTLPPRTNMGRGPVSGSPPRHKRPVTEQPSQQFMCAGTPPVSPTEIDILPVASEIVAQARTIIVSANHRLSQLEDQIKTRLPSVQLNGSPIDSPPSPISDRDRCPRCSGGSPLCATCPDCAARLSRPHLLRECESPADARPSLSQHPLDSDLAVPVANRAGLQHPLARDPASPDEPIASASHSLSTDPVSVSHLTALADPHQLPIDISVPDIPRAAEAHALPLDPSVPQPAPAVVRDRVHSLSSEPSVKSASRPLVVVHDLSHDPITPAPAPALDTVDLHSLLREPDTVYTAPEQRGRALASSGRLDRAFQPARLQPMREEPDETTLGGLPTQRQPPVDDGRRQSS